MPDAAPLEPGDPRALGQYEVIGRLGAGGQGAVFLGKAPGGQYVAVKLLHAQMANDPAARARFTREVSAAQKVEPFCTARVLEADVHGDQPYVVSEFIDGPSLHDVVAHDGPRGAAELERLAIGTVTALAAIHEAGIVHRDFKPNNVMLASDGPRVVDFGIARTVNSQESAVTATGMVVGTPGYLAPEQLTGAPLTPAVDIFAWAATMVFAATGQSPFEADTLPVIINRILNEDPDLSALPPGPLRDLIGRCLSKDAGLRPPAPQLLLNLLGHVGAAPAGQGAARRTCSTRAPGSPRSFRRRPRCRPRRGPSRSSSRSPRRRCRCTRAGWAATWAGRTPRRRSRSRRRPCPCTRARRCRRRRPRCRCSSPSRRGRGTGRRSSPAPPARSSRSAAARWRSS
ncbi:serine/threonine-protein kinase [Actinomadura madurae]|uniref:serine/threonine-protein kinase n=1 Tax=Actinomadura madurae TaxID=1993 RepID=UPI0020D25701|nr:serine/threonine-protein kinase [Actinomadura madurae]MCQ0014697.1 serine/threonine protein kinase [Actinomadura madurae]